MRSRPAGSPAAKIAGVALYLFFAPALFGLIPGQLRWMHALPLEGLTGRLVVDTLVHYLNFPGAAIVTGSMVLIALYLSTTFSFSTAQEWLAIRFAFTLAWRDRWRNWRLARAKAQAAARAARPVVEEEEKIPVPRRTAVPEVREPAAKAAPGSVAGSVPGSVPGAPTQSLWDQMPRTSIPDPEPDFPEEEEEIAV